MKVLIFLTLVACASGQGAINDFKGIVDALTRGAELTLNADSNRCQVENFDQELLVSMPMRNWQIITPTTGLTEIRADDSYVGTEDPNQISFILRTISIFDNKDVVVTLSSTSNNMTSDPIIMNCVLGEGARAFNWLEGNHLQNLDNYVAVKGTLLFGDHVDAVGTLHECRGAEVFEGVEYTVGFMVNRFGVIDDGASDEHLIILDSAIVANDETSGLVMSAERIVLYRRDDSVEVTIGILQAPNLEQVSNFTLQCRIGDQIKFTQNERERDSQWVTYQEVKEATLNGHDMEAVFFLTYCSVTEGEDIDGNGRINAVRFDEFQLFEAGGSWGNLEHIAFSSWAVDVNGDVYYDIIRVFQDGNVQVEYHMLAPGGTAELNYGMLSCPLRTATVFHSVTRTRNPEKDYKEIVKRIQDHGQIYEIEIDLDGCSTAVDDRLGSLFGGIAWETYIDPSNNGYIYANMFGLVTQNFIGTPGPAYDALGILVLPDGTVSVDVRLYDFFTGENLLEGTAAESILCELGDGTTGSVSFYRYPNPE